MTWCDIRRFERDLLLKTVWAVRCYMVLDQVFRARPSSENGLGGEVSRGVASGVSSEMFFQKRSGR